MEWGRLYANLADDRRVQAAEDNGGAGWLLIESMCYCTRAESGGFIPHTQVERFGGGPKKRQKVAALVREKLWIPVEDGYTLDPTIWSEEKNLSDSAEKKREADRKRIAEKRAREREALAAQNGHAQTEPVSRDSSATCRATPDATDPATCRRDSRTPEKRREDKPPTADVVSHPPRRNARGEGDDDLISAVVVAVLDRTERLLSEDEARALAAKVLARAAANSLVVHHPPRYVAAAIANEPDLYESLLLDEPPPLGEILNAPSALKPALCGQCDPVTKLREHPDGSPYRCPECHPKALEAS